MPAVFPVMNDDEQFWCGEHDIDGIQGMAAFAKDAAAKLMRRRGGVVMALHGDLGAGKTTFVQSLAAALGVTRPVTSPTFTLICEHPLPSGGMLVHMDLYRLEKGADLDSIGLEDYIRSGAIVAIEWAERAEGSLPADTIHMHIGIDPTNENLRHIRFA